MRRLLLACLCAATLLLPVDAQQSADEFHVGIASAFAAIERYDYVTAAKYANSAEINYRRTLQNFTREGEDPAEIWKLNLAFQTNLVLLYKLLGQRYFDQHNYNEALRFYRKAEAISPLFPCTHYEMGYAWQRLGQPWKAAVALYEARRLARHPAYRRIVNHYNDDGTLVCPREEVDTRSAGILRELGKSTDHPVELDLGTGKPLPNQVVPAIGAHMAAQRTGIYLEQSLAEVIQRLGEPTSSSPLDDETERQVYVYPGLAVVVDPNEQTVEQLHFYNQGRPVSTPGGLIRVGEHARTVLAKLGQRHGFRRDYNGANEEIREYLDYTELGLVFGIGADDRIALVAIYDLD